MSATSVGQIGLDLVVNQKQFNKQLTGIQSLAKKAGAALAGAFAVTKLVQFGKECVNLGSDLQEVQNVVDVTFPTMSAKVDEFAKSAASSFGLSETMAKKYTGTFGSMAKAFGFTEQSAHDMGTTLTGLAGDVASFYNLSQDEAYTKLKSVFSGETESLKDLGVVMTQSALDSYALANGFGKTTSAMSEAEKVALRYAFVQDKLSAAQGDFQRTSDSWANQTKVLNLQFESLMSTLGQGLISALTPALKMLNQLLQKVQVLATAFKDLMEGVFGTQSEAKAFSSAAAAAEATAESTGTTADNLKKASKFLAGFDVVTKMSDTSSGATGNVSSLNMSLPIAEETEVEQGTDGTLGKFRELENFLKKKFGPSFQKIFSKLDIQLTKFKKTFSKIFKDVKKLVERFTKYMSGPFVNLLNTAFEAVGQKCPDWLDSFNMVFQDAWESVLYPFLRKLISKWLPEYTEFATEVITVGNYLSQELKKGFETIWNEAAKPLLESLTSMFMDFIDLLSEFWNEWGKPIFANLQEAFKQTGAVLTTLWDEILKPMFDKFMAIVEEVWTEHLAPLAENLKDFFGELINGALEIYNSFIVPVVDGLLHVLAPVFEQVFGTFYDLASTAISGFIDFVNGIVTALKGIVQFVVGVFTGDWEKAWIGVKNIFKGIFDSLVTIVKTPVNAIIDIINSMISGIVKGVNTVIDSINAISFEMPDWAGGAKIGFDIKKVSAPKIPKLAEGGFVKKNTPQLAIIGDNRHQGEVVAPENKLTDMAMLAARAASGNDYSLEILKVLKEILEVLKALDLDIVIDGKKLKDIIVEKINQHTRQTGVCEIII